MILDSNRARYEACGKNSRKSAKVTQTGNCRNSRNRSAHVEHSRKKSRKKKSVHGKKKSVQVEHGGKKSVQGKNESEQAEHSGKKKSVQGGRFGYKNGE